MASISTFEEKQSMLKADNYRLAYCFRELRTAVQSAAAASWRAGCIPPILAELRLRRALHHWMALAFTTRTLRAVVCEPYYRLLTVRASRALVSWRSRSQADPRILSYEWPEDDEFDYIISVSRKYFRRTKGDNRTMDVQVRMQSGQRIQLPSSVFRQLQGNAQLMSDFKQSIASVRPRINVSRVLELRSASRARLSSSNSESGESNSPGSAASSSTSMSSSYHSMRESQDDLRSILSNGLDNAQTAEVIREKAATEFIKHSQMLEQAQQQADNRQHEQSAREHVEEHMAKLVPKHGPPARETMKQATRAGVSPALATLLEQTPADQQLQTANDILGRLLKLEQQAANNFSMPPSVQPFLSPYAHMTPDERSFEIAMDAVTDTVWEDHQVNTANSGACLNVHCQYSPSPGDIYCQCGLPTSVLQLRCHHPACGMWCKGTIADSLRRRVCAFCGELLLFNLPPSDRMLKMKEYAAMAKDHQYSSSPPEECATFMKDKRFHISEWENAVAVRLRRAHDPAKGKLLAASAKSSYEAIKAIKAESDIFSQADLLGDEVDWVVTCKLLVAPFKGLSFGLDMLAKLEDFVQASGSLAFQQFIQWTEAAMKNTPAKVDWTMSDAPLIFQRYLQFLTQLLSATLGSAIAQRHEKVAIQFMAAHKAEGRFKSNWAVPVMYLKHAHLLRSYHNMCICWVSESAFFQDMYGSDVLWEQPGTDAQMPMLVARFMKNGVGTWNKVFENKFDQPARQALKQAALDLANEKKKPAPPVPAANLGSDSTDLSPTRPDRRLFVDKNIPTAELCKVANFLWPSTSGKWVKVHLDMCHNCLSKGHVTSDCTAPTHEAALINSNDIPIIDITSFAAAVAKHPADKGKWPNTYKMGRIAAAKAMKAKSNKQSSASGLAAPSSAAASAPVPASVPALPVPSGMGGESSVTPAPENLDNPIATQEKLKALYSNQAIPRSDLPQLSIQDLQATYTISEPLDPCFYESEPYFEFPAIGARSLTMFVPGILPAAKFEMHGKLLDRGETMLTNYGTEFKRCLIVQLCEQRRLPSTSTFSKMRGQSKRIVAGAAETKRSYNTLNHMLNIDPHMATSVRVHSDITARNQALSPYFVKDAWLQEMGIEPIAVWTFKPDGTPELLVFILAADEMCMSKLDSVVTHIAAYNRHAYELRWEEELVTLADVLNLIPRLDRSMGVALDLCTQLSQTLQGQLPIVPHYLNARSTLSHIIRSLDGVSAPSMIGVDNVTRQAHSQCASPFVAPGSNSQVASPRSKSPITIFQGDFSSLAPISDELIPQHDLLLHTIGFAFSYTNHIIHELVKGFLPQVMTVCSTYLQASASSSSSGSQGDSQSESEDDDAALPPGEPEDIEVPQQPHHCPCCNSDGSGQCTVSNCSNCSDQNLFENCCSCDCLNCKTRTRLALASVLEFVCIDTTHQVNLYLTLESVRMPIGGDMMHPFLGRCVFRAWALMGLMRTHHMTLLDALDSWQWQDQKKMDNDEATSCVCQWAYYEMMFQQTVGVSSDMIGDAPVYHNDPGPLLDLELAVNFEYLGNKAFDQLVFNWQMLVIVSEVIQDHASGALTFHPEASVFLEDPVSRLSWTERINAAVAILEPEVLSNADRPEVNSPQRKKLLSVVDATVLAHCNQCTSWDLLNETFVATPSSQQQVAPASDNLPPFPDLGGELSEGEQMLYLTLPFIHTTVALIQPLTSADTDRLDTWPAIDVLTHPVLNDVDDPAAKHCRDLLHRMANNDSYYSDSAELEVDEAIQQYMDVCRCASVQQKFMFMLDVLVNLRHTSTYTKQLIDASCRSNLQGSARWLISTTMKHWKRPIHSSNCPAIEVNISDFVTMMHKTQIPMIWRNNHQSTHMITLNTLAEWLMDTGRDSKVRQAWAFLTHMFEQFHFSQSIFWCMRSITRAINHDMLTDRVSNALALLTHFRSESHCTNPDQVAAIDRLFLQSDSFANFCAQTISSAKGLPGVCLHSGCWHPVCQLSNCHLPACSLNHGINILAESQQKEDHNSPQSTISLSDQVIDSLMSYPEFAELEAEFCSTRYARSKLLPQFAASQSSAAEECFLCTAETSSFLAGCMEQMSFCASCWSVNQAMCLLAYQAHLSIIDCNLALPAGRSPSPDSSPSITSSGSSFSHSTVLPSAETLLAAASYRPNGDFYSQSLSPPRFRQVDWAAEPHVRYMCAVAQHRYKLDGDDWLARLASRFPAPRAKHRVSRTRTQTVRWQPSVPRSESMCTVASSMSSDEWDDNQPLASWLRMKNLTQLQQGTPTNRNSSVIPAASLPAHMLCPDSKDIANAVKTRNTQSTLCWDRGLTITIDRSKEANSASAHGIGHGPGPYNISPQDSAGNTILNAATHWLSRAWSCSCTLWSNPPHPDILTAAYSHNVTGDGPSHLQQHLSQMSMLRRKASTYSSLAEYEWKASSVLSAQRTQQSTACLAIRVLMKFVTSFLFHISATSAALLMGLMFPLVISSTCGIGHQTELPNWNSVCTTMPTLPVAGYTQLGHTSVPAHNGQSQQEAATAQLLELRSAHWGLIHEAESSSDYKLHSQLPQWRANLTAVHSELLHAVPTDQGGPLAEATRVIRSFHPGRALPCTNPTKLAAVLQPAIDQGLLSQPQVDELVEIAAQGISINDFRDYSGPALDLSAGNADDPEHQKILLDFYFAQASKGRVLIFPESDQAFLDKLPSMAICPSFLVFAPGKKPRPILNLSAFNSGPNQLMDDLEPNAGGYATVPKIASQIVHLYVDMALNPSHYSITAGEQIDLAMFVADASDAFYRVPIAPSVVGVQCARVAGYTIVPMCCTFGWKRSAEVFSHITASIIAAHRSGLSSVSVIDPQCAGQHLTSTSSPGVSQQSNLAALLADQPTKDLRVASGHVDDFVAVCKATAEATSGSASDLLFAITSHLGIDGVSVKKFGESSFWSSLQKVIGAWFDTDTFTVTMPQDKIQQTLDILNSHDFRSDAVSFPIQQCSSLRGKLRWALLASRMGDSASLIGIEMQRPVNGSSAKYVKPVRRCGESQEMATAKFHNDLVFYRTFMEACKANPAVASCSMLTLLPLEQRLRIPGQAKDLVWPSGDFSKKAQSFGIECDHPQLGYVKLYGVISHPPTVIAAFESAARGEAIKGEAIVSSVLERFNKFCAEWVFRDIIAGRPCVVLEDNQGSVACINSGYANNVHLQAIQMASNLRQAVDEAPMEAFYTQTENMSFFDKSSRLDEKFVARMNSDLLDMGLTPWKKVDTAPITDVLSEWLAESWERPFPMFNELLEKLKTMSVTAKVATVSLSADAMQATTDLRWQDRVTAASQQIPHYMGSFGPMAYSTSHITTASSVAGYSSLPWKELRARNDLLSNRSCYSLFDAYHGGCGASVAAINAGIFVKGGADIAESEICQFESLTGRSSLGDIRTLLPSRIPAAHIFVSCSSCKDWSSLGSEQGSHGTKGGDHFTAQFNLAAASQAKVVVIENVDGVATLEAGAALRAIQDEATSLGYSRFLSEKVSFALHGDPENRSRRIIVAFHDSVNMRQAWHFPLSSSLRTCAGDNLLPSFSIPSDSWDSRPWYRIRKSWLRSDTCKIRTEGFKYGKDRIGNPQYPARVWHPMGLYPTVLASGNAGLVRWPRLYAMCPVRSAFCLWASGKHTSSKPPGSCIGERRPSPTECLVAKGFPECTPFPSNSAGYRFAGNAVPPAYFEKLLTSICESLDAANVSLAVTPNIDEYSTALTQYSVHDSALPSNFRIGGELESKVVKTGHNVCHHCKRDKLTNKPLSVLELRLMSDQLSKITLGRLDEDSIKAADRGWKHWMSFCSRFRKRIFLKCETHDEAAAAAAQAQLFMTYETACFDIKAASVAQKLWAVGVRHKATFRADPMSGNPMVKAVIADAIALDTPSEQKVPITNTTLAFLKSALDTESRPGFTLWTGVRFAIAFLCRISEWAWNDKYSVKWKHISFYATNTQGMKVKMPVRSVADLQKITQMQVIFFSDKTAKPGESKARTFHAIPDRSNTKCIVRDMARLWLISEKVQDYHCFGWACDTSGVTRTLINKSLKAAAIATGIPGADVSSHSLRCTGLSRLLAAKPNPMPWELAKKFGRWKSDCALRYFWASADIAEQYAGSMWDDMCFARLRGDGEVQYLQDALQDSLN